MSSVSERVEKVLRELNLKQIELAECCGVRKQAITKWLGNSVPSAEAAIRLREKYGVSDTWFILGKGEMMLKNKADPFGLEMAELSHDLSPEAKRSLVSLAREMASQAPERPE